MLPPIALSNDAGSKAKAARVDSGMQALRGVGFIDLVSSAVTVKRASRLGWPAAPVHDPVSQ